MPSRPDLRAIASNVKDAFADADRETLLDVLTFVIKEYVVEGPPPMLIHQAETLSDLRAPTFAQLAAARRDLGAVAADRQCRGRGWRGPASPDGRCGASRGTGTGPGTGPPAGRA